MATRIVGGKLTSMVGWVTGMALLFGALPASAALLNCAGNIVATGTAQFQNADLSGSNCAAAELHPDVAGFFGANFTGSDFTGATLNSANFSYGEVLFNNSDFTNATLNGDNNSFVRTDFTGANLSGATVVAGDSTFEDAIFSGNNFNGAVISASSDDAFENAFLEFATFFGSDLSGVTATQWALVDFGSGIQYDANTVFHASFDPTLAGWELAVVVSHASEPAAAWLALLGIGGLTLRRKRRSV